MTELTAATIYVIFKVGFDFSNEAHNLRWALRREFGIKVLINEVNEGISEHYWELSTQNDIYDRWEQIYNFCLNYK